MPNTPSLRALLTVSISACVSFASTDAFGALPAVNLGSTSFMDGFGDPTGYGLTYMNYLSWSRARSIKGRVWMPLFT